MNPKHTLRRAGIALMLLIAFLLQGTWALAGTTGTLSGIVHDDAGNPIPQATVTVASASATSSTLTDNAGHYTFVSLAPDSYTVSVSKNGYEAASISGVTVYSDQNQTAPLLKARKSNLKEIGRVTSRAPSELVKPGTTADVYSISPAQTQNAQALGGGGNISQTFAALASVPGVFIPPNAGNGQNFAAPYIRGGDYNQVGFEYDGVPVNRAFDNYVSNTQGVTAQQELQVYTGGIPAASSGQGLSGYINQVIKTGTYPGTGSGEILLGFPTAYHNLHLETGGASPNRMFSYYVGFTGWDQDYRLGNNFNGQGINDGLYSGVLGYGKNFQIVPGPVAVGLTSHIMTREAVANFHFGIPHKSDGGKDDIQLLYSTGLQNQQTYNSVNDAGGAYYIANGPGAPLTYPDVNVYNGPVGAPFDPAKVTPYFYPSTPPHAYNAGVIPFSQRGAVNNSNAIVKLQYQKNIGSNAYFRIYGYTNYSNWFLMDQPGTADALQGTGGFIEINPADYELVSHTRGLEASFADQINAKNLISASASYTTATSARLNQTTVFNGATASPTVQLRDAVGHCYSTITGNLTNCYTGGGGPNNPGYKGSTICRIGNGVPGSTTLLTPGKDPCPTVPAAAAAAGASYVVVKTGYRGFFNGVTPKFSAFSLSDTFKPSDRLQLNLGLRYNDYVYDLQGTQSDPFNGGDRQFFFNEYNLEHCYDPTTNSLYGTGGTGGTVIGLPTSAGSGFSCSAGALDVAGNPLPAGLVHTNISNSYPSTVSTVTLEPRIGGTYSFSPDTVLRFSAGKYSQPINAAYVQYNNLAPDLAALTAGTFLQYGFNTPRHDAQAQTSNNYDLSLEHHVKGSQITFKVSPFLRQTKNQTQSFFLDPRTNFVSGLNVGSLRATGVELEVRDGDFNRDGVAAQISYTYTRSKIKYSNFAGTNRNVIDLVNDYIKGNAAAGITGFNQLTSAGGGSQCYSTADGSAVPGAGGACPAGTVVNPYFGMRLASPLDRNGEYSPFDVFPTNGAVGSTTSYEIPHVFTLIAQYKHKGFKFVPTVQYDSGFRYGTPFAWQGIDPRTCAGTAGTTDYSACGGGPFTGGSIITPNPFTGTYDSFGSFKNPGELNVSAQIAQDLGKNATLTGIFTNIYHKCFTRGYQWETGGGDACSYFKNFNYLGIAGANQQVPGQAYLPIQSNTAQGYAPGNLQLPFNVYLSLQFKI